MAEINIADVTLVDNTSQRLPCVLLLDCSGSMSGAPIQQLNEGLRVLEDELKKDDIASQRVQLLLISFGETVNVVSDWTDAADFSAPTLAVNGSTPMGEAVELGMFKIEEQKARYRANGIAYNRPWIFLITDGAPNAGWEPAAAASKAAEAASRFTFFGIGVEGADLNRLSQFSARPPVQLSGLKFRELFVWLSRSTSSASKAAQGSTVQLPPPTDWMQVPA